MTEGPVDPQAKHRQRIGAAISGAGFAGCLAWFALSSHARLGDPLLFVLLAGSMAAELTRAQYSSTVYVSAAFACSMLSVAYLGPAATFVLAVATDLAVWPIQRRRPREILTNLFAVGFPSLLAASIFIAITSRAQADDLRFYLTLAGVAVVANAVNYGLTSILGPLRAGLDPTERWSLPRDFFVAVALSIALSVALAGVYQRVGLAAVVFLVVMIIAFNYMAHLVAQARERSKQMASLSWGVLSGLMRAADLRDPRHSRHAAAVAAFARDIATRAGMSERDVELAHTAGLLHDIGNFALADRVMERAGELGEGDWHAVQQHPALGADMLRDLGLYGPVAEIVRAHHERPDGKGYPDRVPGDQIPELAKIVAVAEVYDTLTAEGTYRQAMNSFEALTEMRRVAGKQLDARYVELLAEELAGKDTRYRHRDDADFYRELDLERRIEGAVRSEGRTRVGLDAESG